MTGKESKALTGCSYVKSECGWVIAKNHSSGNIINKSDTKNWKSVKYEIYIINKVTHINWIKEYNIIYLKVCIEVVKEHLPSLKSS